MVAMVELEPAEKEYNSFLLALNFLVELLNWYYGMLKRLYVLLVVVLEFWTLVLGCCFACSRGPKSWSLNINLLLVSCLSLLGDTFLAI